ncbi:MAG: phasin family protein [Acidobacteriota bacterium]|nr:MAG: hypothetical protein D6738_12200 [Acidobacteriota bacterium]
MIGAETLRNVQDTTMKVTGEMLETGRKVWLAGLGTVAVVEDEVRGVFDTLVEKGKKFEGTRVHVGDKVTEARETVGGLGQKVEQVVQSTVASTLHRLGVPTRDEIHALIDRVEALTRKVEELSSK